jgi:O-antigen/teichoic acid export membrane protein
VSTSKNAVYNIIGTAVPSILTLVTVPLYLHIVGAERYGILTLCWVILGYANFLDLGIGYAVVRGIAATGDRTDEAADIFWTGLWTSAAVAVVAVVAVYFGSRLYFDGAIGSGDIFAGEIRDALPMLAATVPVALIASTVGAGLQGRERFLELNFIGTIAQTLVQVLPLLVAYLWTPQLTMLIAAALTGRMIGLVWLSFGSRRAIPLTSVRPPSRRIARQLVTFGGWVVLATIANGILHSVDRLVIGGTIGAAAVAAYAISYGLISRVYLIPHGLSAALLPRYAAVDEEERQRLIRSSIQAVAVTSTPVIVALVAITEPFFNLWIGRELAAVAAPVGYVLAGGFWIYSIGHMASTMVQATGRPDRVAKVVMAEVLPYCALLFLGIWAFGVVGAAAAFTLRVAVDFGLQVRLARIPLQVLKLLLLPGALVVASVAAAIWLSDGWRYAAFAILFLSSAIWAFLNMPEALRPYVDKLRAFLPVGARAGR